MAMLARDDSGQSDRRALETVDFDAPCTSSS
jgi:hypothetical protein